VLIDPTDLVQGGPAEAGSVEITWGVSAQEKGVKNTIEHYIVGCLKATCTMCGCNRSYNAYEGGLNARQWNLLSLDEIERLTSLVGISKKLSCEFG
jgi:hypothetical protein